MKVELFDYTGAGTNDPSIYAASKLIFTKNTRLQNNSFKPQQTQNFSPSTKKLMEEELDYISKTVPSSWEFVTYDFSIRGVTRAFTHQLVRTRTASYAQEAMRISDSKDFDYLTPQRIKEDEEHFKIYNSGMDSIRLYHRLLMTPFEGDPAKAEDARGLLPTNVLTSICMHANLRTVVYLARVRSSPRVQGEYRRFVEKMVECVQEVHPWTAMFFRDTLDVMEELKGILEQEIPNEEERTKVYKLIDEVKNN